VDLGHVEAEAPSASSFNLPDTFDFYRPPPDYVIQGYANYKAFLHSHAEVRTTFAQGILAFVPTDSILAYLKDDAPAEAHPNKEAAALQHEYRKYFMRGGDGRELRTLDPDAFADLTPGEYFFAVSASGQLRFGRELLREEVARIEAETGHKAPRANHAFLFPGEPLLSAGAFFVALDPEPRITTVTAGSGHYFYSNIQPTIREDIANRSDHYLLTLGHFLRALDRIGVAYDEVLIRKF
jgi:hypothetical protein